MTHAACQPHLLPALPRRRLLLAALAAPLMAACGGGSDSAETDDADTRQLAQAAADAVHNGLVGAAFGRIEPGRTLVRTAGLRRLGGAALSNADLLSIGSNGKAMTAMTIARLVQQGLIGWDTHIGEALPALAGTMRADYAAVTLAQLLDHRGGLLAFNGSAGEEERFWLSLQADPGPLPQTMHGRRLYAADWMLRQPPPDGITPGQDWFYSNAGYMLAATMVEQRTGQDFESLLEQELIRSLGLSMDARLPRQRASTDPRGYEGLRSNLQEQVPQDPFTEDWLYTLAPSGDYACSSDSYARWLGTLMAALRGDTTPLPADAVARLRHLAPDSYALGWQALSLGGTAALMHTGHVPGFMAEAVVAQDGRWAIFGLTNTGYTDPVTGASWVQQTLDNTLSAIQRQGRYLPQP